MVLVAGLFVLSLFPRAPPRTSRSSKALIVEVARIPGQSRAAVGLLQLGRVRQVPVRLPHLPHQLGLRARIRRGRDLGPSMQRPPTGLPARLRHLHLHYIHHLSFLCSTKIPLLPGWRRPPHFQSKHRRPPTQPLAQPLRRPLSMEALQPQQRHSRRLQCRWLQSWLPLFS